MNTQPSATHRSPPPHLLRDGFQACAQRIHERLAASSGRFLAYVDATGCVRATPYNGNPLQESRIARGYAIGVYTRHAQLNEIEDDVLAQARAATQGSTT